MNSFLKNSLFFHLFLFFFLTNFNVYRAQCHYTIDMQDTWGDGWNGAAVEVSINGIFATDFTFANGNNSSDSISTMNGDIVDFSFVSGDWDTEITFQVYDPTGLQILDIGPFANNNGNDGFLLSDTSNSTCLPQYVNVTFQVDMNKVTSGFVNPEINGNWNNYCGNCDPLTDLNGDNIWETTISLFTGNYEFIYSADSLNIEENLDPNLSCSNGSMILPRRFLIVGSQDIIMPVVCWESCKACNDFPQPPIGISCNTGYPGVVFSDDCEAQGNWTGDFGTGNGIWQLNSGGTASGGTGPDAAHSGSSYFFFESSTWGGGGASQFDTATIYSPGINLINVNDDAELTFWMHGRGSSMGDLDVGLSNSPNGPFNIVYSQYGETHTNGNSPWSQIGINVGNYIGQTLYVSFTYTRDPLANPTYTADLAIDAIEVNSCSTCPSPNSLSSNNVTSSSVELNWIPSGNETEWVINYNGIDLLTNTIPTTINNLTSNTLYSCYVRGICSVGDTSASSPAVNFTTGCAYNLAPLTENFDAGFSPCWSQELVSDDFDWTLNDDDTPSNGTGPDDDVSIGGNYMYTEASNPRDDGDFAIMYSEQIDLSNLTNPKLSFYTHMYGSAIGELQIDMFDGNSYVPVFNKIGEYGDVWVEESVLLNAPTNYVHFRITGILGVDANGDTWPGDIAIDEFSVINAVANDIEVYYGGASSACDLSVNEQISAVLVNNGVSSQSNFDVSYKINGAAPITETFNSVINNSDTITFNFATTADMSADGLYNIEFECLLNSDQDASNNVFIINEENYISPSAPITINDTICSGDSTTLIASSNLGQIHWFSDSLGNITLNNTNVSPSNTTTYYAGVQAGAFYSDDFESYPLGSLIGQSSPNWTTPTGGGGQDDAMVSNSQMASGNNSVYLNQLNDDDIYLTFDQVYNSGTMEIIFDLFVGTSAHINLQALTTPSNQELLELRFNPSGMMEFDIGTTTLLGTYPGNNTWCNVKISGDLNTSIWSVYVNGSFQGGASIANGDEVGSVNFKPEIGDEFYIDNVEWYSSSDDDCLSQLSPLSVIVQDCSFISESLNIYLDVYPNPSAFGEINLSSSSMISEIEILDFQGKLVFYELDVNSFNKKVNVDYLKKGIYLVQVKSKEGFQKKKLIIQ